MRNNLITKKKQIWTKLDLIQINLMLIKNYQTGHVCTLRFHSPYDRNYVNQLRVSHFENKIHFVVRLTNFHYGSFPCCGGHQKSTSV